MIDEDEEECPTCRELIDDCVCCDNCGDPDCGWCPECGDHECLCKCDEMEDDDDYEYRQFPD